MAFDDFDPTRIDEVISSLNADQPIDETAEPTAPPPEIETGAETVGVPEPTSVQSIDYYPQAKEEDEEEEEEFVPLDQRPLEPRPPTKVPKQLSRQEVIEEADRLGDRTPLDSLADTFGGPQALEQIPFAGGFISAWRDAREEIARDRLFEDEYETAEEKARDAKYLIDRQNQKAIRSARKNKEWYGIPITLATDQMLNQIRYGIEAYYTIKGAYLPGKARVARWMAGKGPQEQARKVASRFLTYKGVSKLTPQYSKLLRQAENQYMVKWANKAFGTKLLTSLGGIAHQLPFYQGMVVSNMARQMAPVTVYDEKGNPRIEKSQKKFLNSLVESELDTLGEIGFEHSGAWLMGKTLKPVGRAMAGATAPIRKSMSNAFSRVFKEAVSDAAEKTALKQASLGVVQKALRSPQTVNTATGVKRAVDTIMGRVFKKGFAPSAAIGTPLEEYMEEHATAVYRSMLNLDKDEVRNEDGSPKSWDSRVLESLLMPYTRPKESAAMMIAFTALPMIRGAKDVIADRPTVEQTKRNADVFRRFFSGDPLASNEEINNLTEAFVDVINNEDTQRWYAPIFKKTKLLQGPRAGTLESMMQQYSAQSLKDTYERAEERSPGSGKYAIRGLIQKHQLRLYIPKKATRDRFRKLIDEGVLSTSLFDYQQGQRIRERELLLQQETEAVKKIKDKEKRAAAEAKLEVRAEEIKDLKRQRRVERGIDVRSRRTPVRLIADQSMIKDVESPDSELVKYVSFAVDTDSKGRVRRRPELMEADLKLLAKDRNLSVLVEYFKQNRVEPKQNLIRVFSNIAKIGEAEAPVIRITPSFIAKGLRGHKREGFVEIRGDASTLPNEQGKFLIALTLDATARDVAEEVVESAFHRASYKDPTGTAERYEAWWTYINNQIKKASQRKDISKDLEMISNAYVKEAKKPELFETFSSLASQALGYSTEMRDLKGGTSEAMLERLYTILAESDPSFEAGARQLLSNLIGDNVVQSMSLAEKQAVPVKTAAEEVAELVQAGEEAEKKAKEDVRDAEKIGLAGTKAVEKEKKAEKPATIKDVARKIAEDQELAEAEKALAAKAKAEVKEEIKKIAEAPVVEPEATPVEADTEEVALPANPTQVDEAQEVTQEEEDKERNAEAKESDREDENPDEEKSELMQWTDYQLAFNKRFAAVLGYKHTSSGLAAIRQMVENSDTELAKASLSEEGWKKFLSSKGKNALEAKFKKELRKTEATRGDAIGLVTYVRGTHTPEQRQAKMNALGEVEKIEAVTTSLVESSVSEISHAIMEHTKSPATIRALWKYQTVFSKNFELSSQKYLEKLLGNALNPVWIADMEAFNTEEVPEGFKSAEEYALARARYSRFFRREDYKGMTKKEVDKERKLLGARLSQADFLGQWWVDEVTRDAIGHIRKYFGGAQTKSSLTELRRALVNDTFISITTDPNKLKKIENAMAAQVKAGVREAKTAPRSNLGWFFYINREKQDMRPYRIILPSGKGKNNLMFRDQFDRSIRDSEYDEYFFLSGIYTGLRNDLNPDSPDFTGDKKTFVDAHEVSRGDIQKVERQLFNEGESKFAMWAGQYGDNSRVPFVYVQKFEKGSDEAKAKEKDYQKIYNRLKKKKTKDGTKTLAEEFLPTLKAVQAEKDAFTYNYMLNFPFLMEAIHGDLRSYNDRADLVKRGGSIMTPGLAPNTDILGETFNSVVIDDLMLADELGELGEATDGFAYMVDHWAPLYQESLGDFMTKKNVAGFKDLLTAKSILSGVDASERALSKFNFVTLTSQLARQNSNSVHSAIYKLVKDYNDRNPENKIDVVYFKSAAKKHPASKLVKIFDENSLRMPKENPFSADKIIVNRSEDLLYVLDARHSINPEVKKIPVQKKSDLAEMDAVWAEQNIQNERLRRRIIELGDEKGFDYKKELKAEGLSWLIPIVEGKELPDTRNENQVYAQLSYALNKISENKSSQMHPIEVPLAADPASLPSLHAVKKDGSTYKAVPYKDFKAGAEADYVKASRVNLNLPHKKPFSKFRYTEDSPAFKTIADAEKHARKNAEKYVDMFVFDEKMSNGEQLFNSDQWVFMEWELDVNKHGEYRIPGEPVMITRVPGDNAHSHTLARLNRPVSPRGNFIQTAIEDQRNAGVDFDVDSRFVETLFKKQVGDKWVTDMANADGALTESGELNSAILRWAVEYSKPANLELFKTAINKDMGADIVKKSREQEKEEQEPLGIPGQMHTVRANNVIGKQGLGISASESAGLSLMNLHKVLINISGFTDKAEASYDIKIPKSKQVLTLNLTNDEALAKRASGFEYIKNYLGNILNMFADNAKEDIVRHFGINEVTQNIATALMFSNADIQSNEDVENYLTLVSQYLKTDLVKRYTELKRARNNVMARQESKKIWEALGKEFAEEDVKNLRELVNLSNDLYSLGTLMRSQGQAPDRVTDFEKTQQTMAQVKENKLPALNLTNLNAIWQSDQGSSFLSAIDRSLTALGQYVFQDSLYLSKRANQLKQQREINMNVPVEYLNQFERQMRMIATLNGLHQMLQPKWRGQTLERWSTAVENEVKRLKKEDPDNPFLASIEFDHFGQQIRILDIYRLAELEDSFLQDVQKGFDELYAQKPDLAIRLVQYTILRHGLSYKRGAGGYLSLIGPRMSQDINKALLKEKHLWQTTNFNPADMPYLFKALFSPPGQFFYEPKNLKSKKETDWEPTFKPADTMETQDAENAEEATQMENVKLSQSLALERLNSIVSEYTKPKQTPDEAPKVSKEEIDAIVAKGKELQKEEPTKLGMNFLNKVVKKAAKEERREKVNEFFAGKEIAEMAKKKVIAERQALEEKSVDLRPAYEQFLKELKSQDRVAKDPNNTKIKLPDGREITLNNDQEAGLSTLRDWFFDTKKPFVTFEGKAGTGKTTIMKEFLNEAKQKGARVAVAATTHASKDVIRDQTGEEFPVSTIQGLLGMVPDYESNEYSLENVPFSPMLGGNADKVVKQYDLVLVDEASRVDTVLWNRIKEVNKNFGVRFIFSGDREQTSPIESGVNFAGKVSPALDVPGGVFLTQIERASADNPVLLMLDKLRANQGNLFDPFKHTNMMNERGEGAVFFKSKKSFNAARNEAYQSEAYAKDPNAVMTVTSFNKKADEINEDVRSVLFPDAGQAEMVEGENLRSRRTVSNALQNGMNYKVTKVGDVQRHEKTGLLFYPVTVKPVTTDVKESKRQRKVHMLVESDASNVQRFLDLLRMKDNERRAAKNAKTKGIIAAEIESIKSSFLTKHFTTVTGEDRFGRPVSYQLPPALPNGYAVTVDSTQGGTFENVFVDMTEFTKFPAPVRKQIQKMTQAGNIEGAKTYEEGKATEINRKKYTAISRLSKRAFLLSDRKIYEDVVKTEDFVRDVTFSAVELARREEETQNFLAQNYGAELAELSGEVSEERREELQAIIDEAANSFKFRDFKDKPINSAEVVDEIVPDKTYSGMDFAQDLEYFIKEEPRVSRLAYEAAWRFTQKAKLTGADIKPYIDHVRRLMGKLRDPGISVANKSRIFDKFEKAYGGTIKNRQFKAFKNFLSKKARVERLERSFTPDTGIDSKELARYDEEFDESDNLTYSAIALEHLDNQVRRSISPDKELHETLIEELRQERAANAFANRQSKLWKKQLAPLAKATKIPIDIIDAAFGSQQENENAYIFNDAEILLDKDGNPVESKDGTGYQHKPLWVDPFTGKLPSEIPALAPFRGRGKRNEVLISSKILDALREKDAALVEQIIADFKKKTEDQRLDADSRVKGFANNLSTEDWIKKLPSYILHRFKYIPKNIQRRTRAELEAEAKEVLISEHFGGRKASSKEVNKFMALAETKETLSNAVAEAYQRQENQIQAQLKDKGKRASKRKEESGRSEARTWDNYQQAVENSGYLPETLKMTELFTNWQSSVSEVIRNKKYLTIASTTTDAYGNMAMIPTKAPGLREEGKDSAISERNAYGVLNALIPFANQIQKQKKFAIQRGVNPWDQIDEIINEITGELTDRGYTFVQMPGFNVSGVWVKEGAPRQLLKHITSKGIEDIRASHPYLYRTLKSIKVFNNFTKSLALGLSAFHHFALAESYAASYGLNARNPLLTPVHFAAHVKKLMNIHQELRKNPELSQAWVKAGLEFDVDAPDYDIGEFDKMLTWMLNASGKTFLTRNILGRGVIKPLRSLKRVADNFLWHGIQPAMKVQVAEHLLAQAQGDTRYAHVPTEQLMSDISGYVNDAFGGQEWIQYVWANPMARDVMQSLIFAPDWTLSALNVAGVPEMLDSTLGTQLAKQTYSSLAKDQKAEKYWPAFGLLILMGVPAAVQAAIYAAAGDPDEGDHIFPWDNEDGRKSYVDITPIWRSLNKRYGITNRRRTYLRWGKQAYEVKGWAQHPVKTILSKSSMAIKTAMEQLLGKNSAWWDMPWTKSGVFGLFSVDGEFSKSRMAAIGQKFLPMVVTSSLQGRPVTFFAPARLGQSKTEAVNKLIPIIYSFADKEVQGAIASKGSMKRTIEREVSLILDAAEQNGYDRKQVFDEAIRAVRSRYYAEIYKELNRKQGPRDAELLELLRSLRRVAGTPRALKSSLKQRFDNANQKFSSDIRQSVMEQWYASQKEKRSK